MDDIYIKTHLKRLLRAMNPNTQLRLYCRVEDDLFVFGMKEPFTENKVTRQVAIYLITNKILFE
jgi:hypothetical protein